MFLKYYHFNTIFIMAVEDFFKKIDKEINAKENEQKQSLQKNRHFKAITEDFINKLKPIVKPYIDGLKNRGFKINIKDNGLYYLITVTNPKNNESVKIGTTNFTIGKDDFYYVLSNFEEYNGKYLIIDGAFPKDKIISLIEITFEKIV